MSKENDIIRKFADAVAGNPDGKGATHDGETWTVPGTVVRSVDGDTLIATLDLGWRIQLTQYIRLLRINAPEMKTPEGVDAKAYIDTLIKPGDKITVVSRKILGSQDNWGRALAAVTLNDGRDLSETILDAGHAVTWTG